MCVFLWFIFSFLFLIVCLSVTVKWLAVKTASEMTYTVSGGALNSTQSIHLPLAELCSWTGRERRDVNTSPRGWNLATPLTHGCWTIGRPLVTDIISEHRDPPLIGRGRRAAQCVGHVTGENRCCGKTLFSIVSLSLERSSVSELREKFSWQLRSTDCRDSSVTFVPTFIVIFIINNWVPRHCLTNNPRTFPGPHK